MHFYTITFSLVERFVTMNESEILNLSDMTLEKFKLWTPLALKSIFQVRNNSVEGNFDELAARVERIYQYSEY